ncbi:phosphoethanolamine transferase [Oxalobacter formigenes]|uniref:phosphoethanolamine transferase n=1 Tax=Oxalobacter formigenes TaxID=847 RepID=UPI0022AF0154|nr:phosphoethanolamine--lipid A transferase [Oxalobacter formigenes]
MRRLSFSSFPYKFHIKSHWLILFSALYMTSILNLSLWRYLLVHLEVTGIKMFFFGISLPVFVFAALYLLLNIFCLPFLTKPLLTGLLLISSATNYFMFNLGVFIDSDMIRNAFETTTREAMDLMSLSAITWIFITGIIPAALLVFTKIEYKSFWKELRFRLFAIVGSIVTIGGIAALFFKEYAAFGRNHHEMPRLINPTNYIYATVRYYHHKSLVNRQFARLDEKAKLMPYEDAAPTVFILVVGETARSMNFSLNGYPRETNPMLAKEDVISFKDVYSCGTATAISVPCMFSNMGREKFNADDAAYSENLVDLMQQSGFQVLWKDNDDGCKGVCNRVPNEEMIKKNDIRYCDGKSCFDEVLLEDLEEYLGNVTKDAFIVLHTMGSHGPTYYKRYPATFKKFTPTCDTADIQKCTREEVVNTYDNTILYTDYVVANTINILKRFPHLESGLMYVSDHGESLGENNIYLHGLPYSIAPLEQKKVPMVLWMSENMKKFDHLDYSCIANEAEKNTYSHDNLFHTLLALMEVKSSTYDKSKDMFENCRLKPLPH